MRKHVGAGTLTRPHALWFTISVTSRRCLKGLVVTAAIDRGHLRSHRTQIRGQLAPMMNAVIVQDCRIKRGGELEDAAKLRRGQERNRRQSANPIRPALDIPVISNPPPRR